MTALVLPLLLLIGVAPAGAPQPFRVSVNVDLVVLHATVRDRKGSFAPDLQKHDFEIFEDGVPQTIRLFQHEDIPVTVGLVVDHSGSMGRKLSEVVAAARVFVESSSAQDEMFVVNFNDRVTLGLPGSIRFTNRPGELAHAIARTPAIGMTKLYDATFLALDQLRTGNRDKKVLVVVSDGGDNASSHSLNEVVSKAEQSNALLYTIGIFDAEDPDRNPHVLRRLAHATGGEAFFPLQIEEVVRTCQDIARDIRNQYTLGFVSSSAAQGGYRAIRVTALGPGARKLQVRTRAGYVAGGDAK